VSSAAASAAAGLAMTLKASAATEVRPSISVLLCRLLHDNLRIAGRHKTPMS
jgi:hypothetical protein